MVTAMSMLTVIMLLLLVAFISPVAQLLLAQARRARARQRIARAHMTQVVDLVLRMETVASYGLPIFHYISLPLTEEVVRDIRRTTPDAPLDLLVHLPPGVVVGAEAIARALLTHGGTVTLVVPRHAYSGGLLLALAADRVLLSEGALVGAVDLQVEGPAAARILLDRLRSPRAPLALGPLPATHWQRDQPLGPVELRQLGLQVDTELSDEWRRYLALFRQPRPGHTRPFLVRLPPTARRP